MGEITEMILEGILCMRCGCFVSYVELGHPVLCEDCNDEEDDIE